MTLIKSISGIRGTIGGAVGDTLNPLDIVKFTSAYATFIRQSMPAGSNKIVVGRDARISGEMVKNVVCGTLMGMGFDVLNIGLATTPTTELAVTMSGADGGIIITASHNPRQWNALKLLNNKGEFLTAADGEELLKIAEKADFTYADVDHLGHYTEDDSFDQRHIDSVLALKLVDADAIRKAGFKVVVDAVNSVGGVILPKLLNQLGVQYTMLNGQPTGDFAHNPEPLEKNLTEIMTDWCLFVRMERCLVKSTRLLVWPTMCCRKRQATRCLTSVQLAPYATLPSNMAVNTRQLLLAR